MTDPIIINIDVTDWHDELMRTEPDLTGDDPIIDLQLKEGMKPGQVARIINAATETGKIKPGYLPSPKKQLEDGGAAFVSIHMAVQKRKFELDNGKVYEGRAYIAPTTKYQDVEENETPVYETVVDADDPKAVERAIEYLRNSIPGYIWGRLLIIAKSNPTKLDGLVLELKDKIDEMVVKLV